MEQSIKDILKSSSVLIVEDDIVLRKHFRDFIGLYVDNIYEASNGIEALSTFNKNEIDIVFSDIKMPHLNGLALTKKLREINPNVPIVIISAYSEQDTLLQFIKLHLVEYLIKPVNREHIVKSLTNCANLIKDNVTSKFKLAEDIFFDNNNKTVLVHEEVISLSKKELSLLELFIENNNKLVTKEMIEYNVYKEKDMSAYALKNLIFKLRKKLKDENIILTIGTFGYMLSTT